MGNAGGLELTPILRFEKMTGPQLGNRLSPLGGHSGDYDWQPTYGLSAKKDLPGGFEVFSNIGRGGLMLMIMLRCSMSTAMDAAARSKHHFALPLSAGSSARRSLRQTAESP